MGAGRGERVLTLLGYAASILPAAFAALAYFPLFHERGEGERAVSLGAVLLLLLALVPLWRGARAYLRTPSAFKLWLLLFGFFYLTERISSEMLAVSAVGLLGSLVGLAFFRAAAMMRRRRERRERK